MDDRISYGNLIKKCEFIKLELLIFAKKVGSSHGPLLFIVLVWD